MSKGFQFKQFFIAHDQCGMKVGTDSIMLGSWADMDGANSILDVGTGSGILAIMSAQKLPKDSRITAIDIDEPAVAQARENSQNCPWHSQIEVLHTPLQSLNSQYKFDIVIANPPYFPAKEKSFSGLASESEDIQRQQARHDYSLSFEELLQGIKQRLKPSGAFYLVLPFDAALSLIQLAEAHSFYCTKQMQVRTKPDLPPKRMLMKFELQRRECCRSEIVVRTAAGDYTSAYKQLCKDYYLNF